MTNETEKTKQEIESIIEEETKIPTSPETKTEVEKEKAAEEVAKEVAEQVTEKIEEENLKNSKPLPVKKNKEDKKEETKEKKKVPEKPKVRKYEATAKAQSLHVSKKQCMYICSFIKNKKIDKAIEDLTLVTKMKKAVPFKGEIPHRKGDIASGRYPVKAAGMFITILKGLKGNAIVNGMELEDTRITTASASWARRPMRSGNRNAKRTNVILTAKDLGSKNVKNEKTKPEEKK